MATFNHNLGILFIGVGIGRYIPGLPAPIDLINPYIGLIFLILGVVLVMKG